LPKAAPTDELGFARQPNALGVGEALGFATELFQEDAILFLEVFDDSLLVSAHPAGDSDEQELESRRHRVENLSKVPVAHSSIWSRLNFLAVQALASRAREPARRCGAPQLRIRHVHPSKLFEQDLAERS
jgi:hypothetical protein